MNRTLLSIALLVAAGPALAWGERCEFSARREVALDARDLARLSVIAGAGDLTIRGEAGLARATATGTACASSQELLDGIVLVAGDEDGVPTIRATLPDAGWSWGDAYAWLDLEVRVPAAFALELKDSSGDAKIEGVAALEVADSSGDLDIRAVRGAVGIDDSSGDVDVRDSGSVVVHNDSSGDLEFAGIAGDVTIERDSSGDIDLADVRGNARIDVDSSGDIEFTRIQGDATVDRDSSGSVYANGIGGDFVVRADGSGGVSHRDVAGRVDVPDDN